MTDLTSNIKNTCPVCGGKAHLITKKFHNFPDTVTAFSIECTECGFSTQPHSNERWALKERDLITNSTSK